MRALWSGSPPRLRGKGGVQIRAAGHRRDHPRVCGEKKRHPAILYPVIGSPPRMRGKGVGVTCAVGFLRITPAYAGKSIARKTINMLICGSPPRMRGKAAAEGGLRKNQGITPAYAGKRHVPALFNVNHEDHPRVCGEKLEALLIYDHDLGSPPRMRGKVGLQYEPRGMQRITPAYAGKRPFE